MNIEKLGIVTQVVASTLFLIAKFFIWPKDDLKKIIGWVLTLVGTLFLIWYVDCLAVLNPGENFLVLKTYCYSTFILCVYALATFSKKFVALKKINILVRIVVLLFTAAVCFYIVSIADSVSKNMELQVEVSVTGLIGTVMLALENKWSKIAGWLSYTIAHFLSIAMILPLKGYFYVVAQVISIGVAVFAIWKIAKEKEKE